MVSFSHLIMIIKLLGFFDLCTALVIFLIQHEFYAGWKFPIVCLMYMGIKAYAYKGDFASLLDGLVGVYFIFLIFNLSSIIISYIAIIYLAQKGLMSLA